jgi:hypothetical protein
MSGQTDESNLDTPGPSTGLTPRERQIVVDTWGVVKRNAKEAGVELFTRLVQCYTCMGYLKCVNEASNPGMQRRVVW